MIFVLLRLISTNRVTLVACLTAAAGLWLFLYGFLRFAHKHSLGCIAAPSGRGAGPGFMAISSKATGSFTRTAPISGHCCYLYETTVWQRTESGIRKEWTKVVEETQRLPFYIEGSAGKLLVEPLGAELDLCQDFQEEYGLPSTSLRQEDIPPRVSVFLARHGIAVNRPTRVEERSLQPDTQVFIAGTLAENPAKSDGSLPPASDVARRDNSRRALTESSAAPPEIIRLSSGPLPSSTKQMTQQGKIAAALSRAGIANAEAWTQAGPSFQSARQRVEVEDVEVKDGARSHRDFTAHAAAGPDRSRASVYTINAQPVSNPSSHLVLMNGDDNRTFTISCNSQAARLDWKSVTLIVGGAGLTVLGLYVLLFQPLCAKSQ